ncbi:TPA: flavin reductase family protein, partial [Enterococcus faecium]
MPDYKQKAGYSFCSDKFQLGKFTKLAGEEVSTVRIKECPLQIETLVQRIS